MTSLALPKRLRGRKTVSHNHAPKQEKRLALVLGGKVTKASGASYEKGDVRVKGVVRVEAKCTTKKSFPVTRDMLDKIETAAIASGEMPVMVIEFLDPKGKVEKTLAVIPMYALESLISDVTS